MPKIRFDKLPHSLIEHLQQRVRERQITLQQLQQLETWKASQPEAPEGPWYKDFGSFKLCGEGELPKTVLSADMPAYGKEVQ